MLGTSIGVRRYFGKVERQFAQPPFLAPQLHHVGQAFGICFMATYVRLSLIPDEPFDGIVLKRLQHGIVHQHGAEHGMQAFDGIGVERYVWIVFQQFTAYPTFYSGSTVSATDDADRNPEGTAQRSGKIVGRRTEIGCGFYGRYVPATFAVGLQFISLVLGNGEHTHPLILGRNYDVIRSVHDATASKTFQGHFHIALAGSKPYFTD